MPESLSGLPGRLAAARAVRSDAAEAFRDLGAVRVYKGQVETDLPDWSLVSLTTLTGERQLSRDR